MRDLTLRLVLRFIADQFTNGLADARRRLLELSGTSGTADTSLGGFQNRVNRTLLSVLDFGGAIRGLIAGFSLLALVAGVKSLIKFADDLRLTEGRIRNASNGLLDFARNYLQLANISLSTGTNFFANAEMFSRISSGIKEMGGASSDALRQVDLLAKGLVLSNAGAAESASVIRQWGQAMQSGLVRGDEFNSLMENGGVIALALAKGLHVSTGALRSMAEAGELTSVRVSQA
jgi:tape measure domain-containing protein